MEFARKRWVFALTAAVLAAAVVVALLSRRRGGAGFDTGPVSAKARGVVVEVRNGTNRAGLARQVARLLREEGVDVVYVGTSSARPDSTTILVRRGPLARGHEIARLLGGARVRQEPDSLVRVDLTVLLGADYRFPKGRLVL